MGNIVSLLHITKSENNINNYIINVINRLDISFSKNIDEVLIKPNLCYYWDANTGYTTDPRIVFGIISWVKEYFGNDVSIKIVESDASSMRTKLAFKILGYEKLANESNIELINLSNDQTIEKSVLVNNRKISYKIPKMLLDNNFFINVPKLKIMKITKITCAMKNLFGCIAKKRKVTYHPYINEAIVGINKILKPNLTIVDGLVALGSHPKYLGLLMASSDVFSVDYVAAKIMGYRMSQVKFLQISEKEGVGNSSNIKIIGAEIEQFRKNFPRESVIPKDYLLGISLKLLDMYAKIVGDIIPPFLEE